MTQHPITPEQMLAQFNRPRRLERSAPEESFLASGRCSTVEYRGLQLATWVWPGRPRVLLMHGWDSQASHLAAIGNALQAAGFGLVAFDAPAHGQSDGETSSVVDIGRAMLAIARAHGPFDAVVAHSVGSPAALYAFAHGLTTRASVHIAGPASLERVLIARSRLAGLPADQLPAFRALVEADIQAKIADMELESLARGFRHPALLLHAPDDGEISYAESEALNRAWPGSRLVPLPGLGHRRIIGAAETIGLVTGFLDQQLRADATAAA